MGLCVYIQLISTYLNVKSMCIYETYGFPEFVFKYVYVHEFVGHCISLDVYCFCMPVLYICVCGCGTMCVLCYCVCVCICESDQGWSVS